MNKTGIDSFGSLYDALEYVGLTSGLYLNETHVSLISETHWPSIIVILPLILGFIGLVFNILALLIFTASKTFRQSSFRCYIYAFVLVNCASILTYSWFYLIYYVADPIHLCKYLRYFQKSLSTISLWIMVLLSSERSITFTRPFAVKKLLKSRTICLILIFVACFCFVLHIDEVISVQIKAFRWVNFAYGLCSTKQAFHFTGDRIKIVTHLLSFILPFLLNSMLDIYICFNICKRRKRLALISTRLISKTTNKTKRRQAKKTLAHEITITLLCQSLWLLLTYFPTHLYYFLISFKLISGHDNDNSTLISLMRHNLLVYLAFSSTLFVILSPTLRREIHSYIRRSCKRHRQRNLPNISSTNNTLRNISEHHRHHQGDQQNNQKVNLTILITITKPFPNGILSKSISTPTKILYISKSVPSLYLYDSEVDGNQSRKTERSNTLQK